MSFNFDDLSRFLSYVLRHEPEHIGLELDSEGWGNIKELISGSAGKGVFISLVEVEKIVSMNDKKRFEISSDGLRIRAIQGHSTKLVSRRYSELEPPEYLYHGTAERFLESIRHRGLVPGSRHHVHLTSDRVLASEVGRRYGKVILLKINSQSMYGKGFVFFKSENEVWLTDCVPADFIIEVDEE
ncbi:RNA 2'-phosphotransferase [Pseudomonas bananamidigenes]|uniref:RNA 2'-phosphotransferase n=1 Tax=Pseudomonas bananamidigenes TaxID=2843610 RepID=UPI0009E350E1|nr:RNA 2'-phosphotransferase [Pseudomonas bananamidigenes]